jgi:hypothetical protein
MVRRKAKAEERHADKEQGSNARGQEGLAAAAWEGGEGAAPWGFIARRLWFGGQGGAVSMADERDGAAA